MAKLQTKPQQFTLEMCFRPREIGAHNSAGTRLAFIKHFQEAIWRAGGFYRRISTRVKSIPGVPKIFSKHKGMDR